MNWEDQDIVEKRKRASATAMRLPWSEVVAFWSPHHGLVTRWKLRNVPWSEVDAPIVTSDGRKLHGNCCGSRPNTLRYTYKYYEGIVYLLQPVFVPQSDF